MVRTERFCDAKEQGIVVLRRRCMLGDMEVLERTYAADHEWDAEPHLGADHFVDMEKGDEEEEDGEDYGGGEVGNVVPEVDDAFVSLEFRHFGYGGLE
jgi:hypothetical protein